MAIIIALIKMENSKIKTNIKGIKYIKTNGKTHILSNNNIDKNKNFHNSKYEFINNNYNNLDNNKKTNLQRQQTNNENINKIINTNTYNKINIPIKKINKRKIQINNEIQINNRLITETYNPEIKDNISSSNIYKNKMDSITERNQLSQNIIKNPFKINMNLKIVNRNNGNFIKNSNLFEINNGNNRNNNSNINNCNIYKSNNFNIKKSLLFNSINNNDIMHTNSFKNNNDYSQNIIINNLIIKNRCNKLIYNNNLIKNGYINGKKLKENNRYKGISQMEQKS